MIDLHTHTNKSDDQYFPKWNRYQKYLKSISILVITDNDTIFGLEDAAQIIMRSEKKQVYL